MTQQSNADFSNKRSNTDFDNNREKTASRAAYENAANFASETADQVKQAAADTVSSLGDHLRQVMDAQVESGAAMVGAVANSLRTAASELEGQQNLQMSKFTRLAADQLDRTSAQLQNKTADALMRDASDFTRRHPAVVFGAGALLGFFALRAFRNATVAAPSIQPEQRAYYGPGSEFHGL